MGKRCQFILDRLGCETTIRIESNVGAELVLAAFTRGQLGPRIGVRKDGPDWLRPTFPLLSGCRGALPDNNRA